MKKLLFVLAARLLLWPRTASADEPASPVSDTSDLEGLLSESVVQTASKSSEVQTTAPATTTTITAEELKTHGIQTLAEAIDYLSLGAATSDSYTRTEVGARGVLLTADNGDHMLLLVNGHAINNALFTGMTLGRGAGIPIEMIDHIEVILGPGSVLYGSNAMLGVINVITKRAKDWHGVHAGAVYEPNRSYRVTAGTGLQVGSNAELTLGLEYYDQKGPPLLYDLQYAGVDRVSLRPLRTIRNGPENGYWGGVVRNAYYERQPSGLLRFVWGDFEVNAQAVWDRRGSPYRARFDKSYMDFDDPDSYDENRHVWVDVTHRASISSIFRLTTRGYFDAWDYYTDVNSSGTSACFAAGAPTSMPTCTLGGRGVARWGGVEMRGSLDWLRNEKLVTTLGVDERIRKAGFKIDFLDFATRQPFASSAGHIERQDNMLGAYAQQTWVPTRALSFNAGARLDLVTRFDPVVSPRAAGTVRTWEGGALKAIYAEAFRAPSFIESDLDQPLQPHAGTLLPERVRSAEVSFEQTMGAHRLLFGAFRSWWQDMIENHQFSDAEERALVASGRIPVNNVGIGQYRNVANIDNYGWNARAEGAIARRFHYGLNGTAAIAQRDEAGRAPQPLSVAPKLFGNARVAYDLPGRLPTLALSGHFFGTRPIDRAFDGGWTIGTFTPPQLELRLTITGAMPFVKGLSYRAQATYAFHDRAPYVVGINQSNYEFQPVPNLMPVDQFRTAIGLTYDFDWADSGKPR